MYMCRVVGDFAEHDGYVEGEPSVWIEAPEGWYLRECEECGEYIEGPEDHDPECDNAGWCPEPGIEDAFNWACAEVSGGEVRVCISIGDPRGALSMTLRRTSDGLLLHVPHPDDTTGHVALSEVRPGTYRIRR